MESLRIIVVASCFCYLQATTVSTDNVDVEKFTLAESKNGRNLPFKQVKDNIAAPSYNRPPTNIIYGKSGKVTRPAPQAYLAPSLKSKPAITKFKPSVEDTSFDGEQINSYGQPYKPTQQETVALQKYMQRYASQVMNAQKHAALLSDNQKHVISSDPYKKYIPSTPNKYKFVPVFSQDGNKDKYKDYDTVEINTEKYQNPFVVQPLPKSVPKKAYTYDSAQQPSEYKYSSEDVQLASQLMAEPEKSSWGSLEPYQYGIMAVDKNSDLSKITGYKIPAATSITLGHSIETKEEEKAHEEHEEHYPHHEPKYEYMYQVHDPEKHNNFGHSEARKGKNTWGRYYVQLPDGRLETVKYWVDKSGYHAEVDFKGEAKHPSYKEYAQQEHKEHTQQEHKEFTPQEHKELFSHQEESPKSYPKISESSGLGGHSEMQFTLSDAIPVGEEY